MMMYIHAKYIFFITLFCCSFSLALAQEFNTVKGIIHFRSDAPLELIKASSNEMRGKLDATKKAFAFTVKIRSFAGFNSALQEEHFNDNYLESKLFPDAYFCGKIIEDIDFSKNGTYTVRAKGNLNIHGITQERIIKSEIIIIGSSIRITSAFTVQLSDHNIPVPKVVHEKLASEINVEVTADMISK